MMMSARGMSLVLTQGRPVYIPNNKTFNLIHNYNLFKYIPLPVIYFAVIALLTHFLLKRTSTGRYLFATGSNEEAARLS